MPQVVRTVLGDVDPSELGITLMHEHLIIDNRVWLREPRSTADLTYANAEITLENQWWMRQFPNMSKEVLLLADEDLALREVMEFTSRGGGTMVELTTVGLGRDPLALARIARRGGLHVIAGAGFYVGDAHPAWVREADVDALSDTMVRDITEGIDGSDVRAGIIGEIGISAPIGPSEKRVLQAAARAQEATGAAISIHTAFTSPEADSAIEAAEILGDAGADLSRVIMGHVDLVLHRPDYHRRILELGCYLEFDLFGQDVFESGIDYQAPGDTERVRAAASLIEAGHSERLLFSQDVCYKIHLQSYGGFGYGHILRNSIARFGLLGISRAVVIDIMTTNPARILPLQK